MKLPQSSIDIDDTVNSGQVFLWERLDGSWFGIDGNNVIRASGDPPEIESINHTEGEFFRLGDDIGGILSSISADRTVRDAVRGAPGLRLLRQDPFQCYISFIVSANSNIRNIRGSLQKLCGRYGRRVEYCKKEFRLFPTAQRLSGAGMAGLLECGLGYRAKFVRQASRDVASGRIDLGALRGADYYCAREGLTGVPGIGGKVADCIMLFALDKLEAFPLDRWMYRILAKYYPGLAPDGPLGPKRYHSMHERIAGHFGPYAGYAQQFLFKMERDAQQKKWLQ